MKKIGKREESKWRLLAENVITARNSLGPFSSSRRSASSSDLPPLCSERCCL